MLEAKNLVRWGVWFVLNLPNTCSTRRSSNRTACTQPMPSSPGKNSPPSTGGAPPSSRGLLEAGANEDMISSWPRDRSTTTMWTCACAKCRVQTSPAHVHVSLLVLSL